MKETKQLRIAEIKKNYFIREDGMVKNCQTAKRTGGGTFDIWYNGSNTSGYKMFQSQLVHRLVAKEWIPNPENKPQVNHIDGDKTNNHISNLEWCTAAENLQHAFRTGLIKTGQNHHSAILSDENVLEIRELLFSKLFNQSEIAKFYNISPKTVSRIKHNQDRFALI